MKNITICQRCRNSITMKEQLYKFHDIDEDVMLCLRCLNEAGAKEKCPVCLERSRSIIAKLFDDDLVRVCFSCLRKKAASIDSCLQRNGFFPKGYYCWTERLGRSATHECYREVYEDPVIGFQPSYRAYSPANVLVYAEGDFRLRLYQWNRCTCRKKFLPGEDKNWYSTVFVVSLTPHPTYTPDSLFYYHITDLVGVDLFQKLKKGGKNVH